MVGTKAADVDTRLYAFQNLELVLDVVVSAVQAASEVCVCSCVVCPFHCVLGCPKQARRAPTVCAHGNW